MKEITVISVLYQGEDVPPWSQNMFNEKWADKLYRGIARNLSNPFRFVCLVDQDYQFEEPIDAIKLENPYRNMFSLLECLRPDIDDNPKMFMGLDTIITGNIDNIAQYSGDFAMIRDPYFPENRASGVMLFQQKAASEYYARFKQDQNKGKFTLGGFVSDMVWLDQNIPPCDLLQDLYPNQIVSYKADLMSGKLRWNDAKIIYFHGEPKPHRLGMPWVKENWK